MRKIISSTGVMLPDCQICFDNEANWDFGIGENRSEVKEHFYICEECAVTLIGHLINHYPQTVDLSYIWYLRTSREMQGNDESEHIQKIIEEGLRKLDKYKKEEVEEKE